MPRFESLEAWQQAHKLALGVYALSRDLPEDEKFGLTSQLRRAAVSAAANIAEGRERESDADFSHFLTIAAGSAAEVQYYLILGRDLGYWTDAEVKGISNLAAEVIQVIRALRDSLHRA